MQGTMEDIDGLGFSTEESEDGSDPTHLRGPFCLYFGVESEDEIPWDTEDEQQDHFGIANQATEEKIGSLGRVAYPGSLLLAKRGQLVGNKKLLNALGAHISLETKKGTSLSKIFQDLNMQTYDKVFTKDVGGEISEQGCKERSAEHLKAWNANEITEEMYISSCNRLTSERKRWRIRQDFLAKSYEPLPIDKTILNRDSFCKIAQGTNKLKDTVLLVVPSEREATELWNILAERNRARMVVEGAAQKIDISDVSDLEEAPSLERPQNPYPAPAIGSSLSPQQTAIAEKLFERSREIIGQDAFNRFSKIDFLIVGPRFTSLRAQTSSRVVDAGLAQDFPDAESKVVPHDVVNYHQWKEFRKRLIQDKNRNTLFVIVDDECHFGPTKSGAHDVLVNLAKFVRGRAASEAEAIEEAFNRKNLLVLQVSATPQNCLTAQSQVDDRDIVRWNYDSELLLNTRGVDANSVTTSLYRSLDWTLESFLWRLAPSAKAPRTIELRSSENKTLKLENLDELLEGMSFAQFDFADFARIVEEIFKNNDKFSEIKFRIDERDEILSFWFPSQGWKLVLNEFTRDVLGFGNSDAAIGSLVECDPQVSKLRLFGRRSPAKLCEPAEGGTLPRAYQHVLSDEFVQSMITEWTKSKRKNGKSGGVCEGEPKAVGKGKSATKNGHPATSAGRSQITDEDIRIIQEHEAHLLVADYVISMAYFAFFRLRDEFSTDERHPADGPVLSPTILSVDDPSIGRRLKAMSKALSEVKTECPCWRHTGVGIDFRETLTLVMNSYEQRAHEQRAHEEDAQEDPWLVIIKQKLISEEESLVSNNPLDWYTESDRLIKTLLDVDTPGLRDHRKGYMTFTRVYGTDRSHLLQLHLREIMKIFGMYYHVSDANGGEVTRPIFAVVSDNGDVKLREEIWKESWADVALDISGDDTVERRFESQKLLGYEMLQDVPCLVLLCEKGRMGDTFPQSLRLIDVRARAAGQYTTMIQEFGRICRYPKLDNLWRIDVMKDGAFKQHLNNAVISRENLVGVLKKVMTQDYPIALFRPKSGVSGQFSDDISKLAMFSTFLGQAECDGQLETLLARSQPGDVILRYRYPMPTLLVSYTIANLLTNMVQLRNDEAIRLGLFQSSTERLKRLRELPRLTACITMDMDQYMERLPRAKKKGVVLSPDVFRRDFNPTEKHYDHQQTRRGPRRLLLFAECQMGKTGVFLEFLRKWKEHCEGAKDNRENQEADSREWLPVEVPTVRDAGPFLLPVWTQFYPNGSIDSKYCHPKDGQYHTYAYAARARLYAELGDDKHRFGKEIQKRECILSNFGRTLLSRLSGQLFREECIDWDGKMSDCVSKFSAETSSLRHDVAKWTQPLTTPAKSATRHPFSAGILRNEGTRDAALPVHKAELTFDNGVAIPFRMSLPPQYENISALLSAPTTLPWVFVPSHNRSEHASLDYAPTLEPERVVVIACREGEQFDKYCKAVGHRLPIVAMPLEFDFTYPGYRLQEEGSSQATDAMCSRQMSMKVSAAEHRIGHARLFIQLLSRRFFKLDEIWMLDDNIVSCFDRLRSDEVEGDRLRSDEIEGMRCRFQDVMQAVERVLVNQLMGKTQVEGIEKEKLGKEVFIPSTTIQSRSGVHGALPFPRRVGDMGVGDGVANSIKEYSGHRDNFGVLGITRPDQFGRDSARGFARPTTSLYSFLLLNLKTLEEKGVYFPAKPWMEDIEFMHCVHESGLAVVRFNRFFYSKNHPRPPKPRTEIQPLVVALQKLASEYSLEWRDFDVDGDKNENLVSWAQELRGLIDDDLLLLLKAPVKRAAVITLSFAPETPEFTLSTQWRNVLTKKISKSLEGCDAYLMLFPSPGDGISMPNLDLKEFKQANTGAFQVVIVNDNRIFNFQSLLLKRSPTGVVELGLDAKKQRMGAAAISPGDSASPVSDGVGDHEVANRHSPSRPRKFEESSTKKLRPIGDVTISQVPRRLFGQDQELAQSKRLRGPDQAFAKEHGSNGSKELASDSAIAFKTEALGRDRAGLLSATDQPISSGGTSPTRTTDSAGATPGLARVLRSRGIQQPSQLSLANPRLPKTITSVPCSRCYIRWQLEIYLVDSTSELDILGWRVFGNGSEILNVVENEDQARARQESGQTLIESLSNVAIDKMLESSIEDLSLCTVDSKREKLKDRIRCLNEFKTSDKVLFEDVEEFFISFVESRNYGDLRWASLFKKANFI